MVNLITLKENEKYLRQKSKKVVSFDEDLMREIKELKEYSLNNAVFAMAAIQLGMPKRLVFVKSTTINDTTKKDACFVLINPEIISQRGRTEYLEACQSCLEYAALVERPYEIVVKFQDEKGKLHKEKFEGFTATILSHEIDHLDGILHMDRAKEVFNMAVDERIEFRKTHPYKIISKDCEFSYDKPKTFQR